MSTTPTQESGNRRLTVRQAFKESNLSNVTPEYLVVQFEVDKEVCAVPVERLTGSGAVCVGEQCEVKWTNGETYTAKVLAQGSRVEMRRKEMELISRCTENEKENNEPPRKKQKADKPKRKLNFSGKKKKKEAEIKKSQKKRNAKENDVFVMEVGSPPSECSPDRHTTATDSPSRHTTPTHSLSRHTTPTRSPSRHTTPTCSPDRHSPTCSSARHTTPHSTENSSRVSGLSVFYGEKRAMITQTKNLIVQPPSQRSDASLTSVSSPDTEVTQDVEPGKVIVINSPSTSSLHPPSPQLDKLRFLTDLVMQVKASVDSMDKRLQAIEEALKLQQAPAPSTPMPRFSLLDDLSLPLPVANWYQSSPYPTHPPASTYPHSFLQLLPIPHPILQLLPIPHFCHLLTPHSFRQHLPTPIPSSSFYQSPTSYSGINRPSTTSASIYQPPIPSSSFYQSPTSYSDINRPPTIPPASTNPPSHPPASTNPPPPPLAFSNPYLIHQHLPTPHSLLGHPPTPPALTNPPCFLTYRLKR